MRMKSNHTQLSEQVVDLVALLGGYARRNPSGIGQKRGRPDIDGCYRGRFIAVEVKTGRGTVSLEQQAELNAIREAGGIAIVARSLEDVLQGLREIEPEIDKRVKAIL